MKACEYSTCEVCGRSLSRRDEKQIGMCVVCANEEFNDPEARKERNKSIFDTE